jgi:transcriptional regulator GlxA family with amidase domain
LAYAKRNLDKPLTVSKLAEAAHLSPRQFSRSFRAETAISGQGSREPAPRGRPAVMEQSHHPIEVIAVGKPVLPTATACAAPFCAPSDSRPK